MYLLNGSYQFEHQPEATVAEPPKTPAPDLLARKVEACDKIMKTFTACPELAELYRKEYRQLLASLEKT